MSEDKKERFGRYLILDHLVDGGMAKICRARYLGEQADKIVAVKMVQPKFSADENFKTMFIDEIKTTFGLIHPNIVQTYDYGLHNDQLYVAMEYCDGRNLKEYLDKLKARKFVFPVEISVYIITQVCQGLHYAHTHTDKLTGQQLNIIHRDISPHNIMLTFDGAIKVIDFGIAKADTQSEATQAGTIKGKLSYLAPEYLEGKDLDPRYDEFAVGITLWEMLCSQKLFKAKNDLAVLKKIQECSVPAPSSINPNVPKELDEIVLKSLSKNPDKRYENLDQLNRALIKFLYANYPDFNASDLGYFAQELFKEEISEDRSKLQEYGKIDIKPYLEELSHEQAGGGGSPGDDVKIKKEAVLDFGFSEKRKKDTGFFSKTKEKKIQKKSEQDKDASLVLESKRQKLADVKSKNLSPIMPKKAPTAKSAGAKTKTVTVGNKTKTSISKKTTVAKEDRTATSIKRGKTGMVQFEKKKKKSNLGALAKLVAVGVAGFFAYTNLDLIQSFVSKKEKRVPSSIKKEAKSNGSAKVFLKGINRYKDQVYVNGKKKDVDFMGGFDIPSDQQVVVRVESKNKKHYVKSLKLGNGSEKTIAVPPMPTQKYGYILTSRKCAKGKIYFKVFNEQRVEDIPIKNKEGIALPVSSNGRAVASQFQIFYKLDGEDLERQLEFEVGQNEIVDLCDKF